MRASVALSALALAACPNAPPALPGEFFGSFQFNGTVVLSAGASGGTSCFIAGDADAGAWSVPATVQFYAYLSLLDAGTVAWEVLIPNSQNTADGGWIAGTTDGGWLQIQTPLPRSSVSACGDCVTDLTETVSLFANGGLVSGLSSLVGVITDSYAPLPGLDGGVSCDLVTVDAGGTPTPECLLSCEVVYAITGSPGQP